MSQLRKMRRAQVRVIQKAVVKNAEASYSAALAECDAHAQDMGHHVHWDVGKSHFPAGLPRWFEAVCQGALEASAAGVKPCAFRLKWTRPW